MARENLVLKIGLTGGIGSGKSTVARYFAKLKVPIIDADEIVHELLKPKTSAYKKIVAHFGKTILTSRKLLNKKKLRDTIFSDSKERIWLEKLLHPQTIAKMQKDAKKTHAPYCILAIPLLFETRLPIKVDRILVVDCPKKTQIYRIHNRDHSSIKQIQNIIKTQINRGLRLQKAHDIIRNTGTLKNLEKEVKKLHLYYLSLV